jgi:glycosyltransferase involved in cell wall biosynthesis
LKISIVIPSLNQGKFIHRTIDSILDQGFPNLELIVMDGGSTDETLSILRTYGTRILWQSASDRGQTQAVNKGWKIATGQILGWVNSDDILLPGALLAVAEGFQSHPEARWLYGLCYYIDSDDQIIGEYPVKEYDYRALVCNVENYIPQPAVFIHRSILDEVGLLNEDLHYVMDLEYWLRIGLHYPAVYLDTPLAALRLHQEAKSIASFGKFSSELTTIIKALFERPDLPENIRELKRDSIARANLLAADMNFWSGDLRLARHFAMKSWRLKPLRLRRLYLYLMLGRIGMKIANRNLRNPYTNRMEM